MQGAGRDSREHAGDERDLHRIAATEAVSALLARVKSIDPTSFALRDDDDFLHVLDMDSIDAVELTIELDEAFDLRFGSEPEDVDHLKSFGALVDLVLRRGTPETFDVLG